MLDFESSSIARVAVKPTPALPSSSSGWPSCPGAARVSRYSSANGKSALDWTNSAGATKDEANNKAHNPTVGLLIRIV